MPSPMRSVPLAEKKAEARALQDEIDSHKRDCRSCGIAKCGECRLMESALRLLRHEIKNWWKPPAGTPALF